MQYTSIVKNLLPLKPHGKAMTIRTGLWTNQCLAELKKFCKPVIAADNIAENDCTAMVPYEKWKIDPEASFFCFCANETVNGFEQDLEKFPWHLLPKGMPACIDMSSNIGTTRIPWDNGHVGVVYMGAQKNLGTAGCTVVIVREDLMGHAMPDTPIIADWATFEKAPDTYYNTPAVFPMYITGLNCAYMNQKGGLEHYILECNQKGRMMWDFVESTNGYYKPKITQKEFRSRLNIVVRILGGDTELEAAFVREAQKAGITQVKGHTFSPGLRFSIYNAMPVEGVTYLTQFMRKFMIANPGPGSVGQAKM